MSMRKDECGEAGGGDDRRAFNNQAVNSDKVP